MSPTREQTDPGAVLARARAHAILLTPLFRGCHAILYADQRREREVRRQDEDDEGVEGVDYPRGPCECEHPGRKHPKWGACEAYDHRHERECACEAWTPQPSTVGWSLLGGGLAAKQFVAATYELQRAHDASRGLAVARWAQVNLGRPREQMIPIPLHLVLDGVRLMQRNLARLHPEDLEPMQVASLASCEHHLHGAVRALCKAQDRLEPKQWGELNVNRCVEPWCQVGVHADGRCREHYDRRRRAS